MVSLLLATLLSAGFGLILNRAGRAKANLNAVGAVSYSCATIVNLVAHARTGNGWVPMTGTWTIGMLGGLAFVTGFSLLFRAMSLRGVSVATTMLRLSVVVPMLASWLLWGERLATLPTIGAILAVASLPLLTLRPEEGFAGLKSRSALLLLGLFLVNGGCLLAVAAFDQTGIQGQSSLFLAILFGTAAVVACILWSRQRQGTSLKDLLHGIPLGLADSLAYLSLVAAIGQLPGLLVFPFYSSVGVVFTALFARIVWHERITRLEMGGIGLAVVAVVLANV